MRLSLAAGLAGLAFGAACGRPDRAAADTAVASSTNTPAAAATVDTLATTTESTSSVSTVTRTSPARKLSGSVPHKNGATNSVQSPPTTGKDSVLGRDSVIRFPIRRLPTASSTPVKR